MREFNVYRSITKVMLLLLFAVSQFQAQVVINEYSASNLDHLDSYEKSEDWIELYNAGSTTVDISGYHLSDKSNKPKKWEIPAGTSIGAGDHLVFYCSGRDIVHYNEYHTNFKISQTKGNESVVLSDRDGNILEEYEYNLTLLGASHCRVSDGADEWKICVESTVDATNNFTEKINRYTQQPTIENTAGFYQNPQSITIVNNEPNSILRYTTNGHNPTENSPEYTGPILVDSTRVVKAQAFSNVEGVAPGKMDFATFFINESFTLDVYSVAADRVQNLANGEGALIPIGSLEYFNKEGDREATAYGSLNRHGQDSWALDHRSIDWVTRDEMGYSRNVKAKLFSYSDREDHQRLMFRASGDDNYPAQQNGFTGPNHLGSCHVRDEYVHTLALEGNMKLDVRAVERVILFLNGEFWGVYGLRERPVDHDYTEEYYDQEKHDLQYLTTWGATETEYGGRSSLYEWLKLRDFILNNDMSDPEAYQKVKDQMQVQSLMDYMIANLNSVASDWLNYNTGWWRGLNPEGDHKKWGYILWDNDATFDYYINYSGVPNTQPNAVPCDIDEISDFMDGFFGTDTPFTNPLTCASANGVNSPDENDRIYNLVINENELCCNTWTSSCQSRYDEIIANGENVSEVFSTYTAVGKHEKIFLKLQDESEDFRQHYYSRQADLMNTVYTCENMLGTFDKMVSVIAPEMPKQIARWGGSMALWEANVARMRGFIEDRCELLDEGMTECFDITGPYELTLRTEPAGEGEIDLNTLDIRQMPWTGRYFGEMDNKIKARAFDDDTYFFSHWETANGSVIADPMAERTTIVLSQDDTLTAVFTTMVDVQETESGHSFDVHPNPAQDYITLSYELAKSSNIQVSLYNSVGQKVTDVSNVSGLRQAGRHVERIDLSSMNLKSGLHLVEVKADHEVSTFKVMVVE